MMFRKRTLKEDKLFKSEQGRKSKTKKKAPASYGNEVRAHNKKLTTIV